MNILLQILKLHAGKIKTVIAVQKIKPDEICLNRYDWIIPLIIMLLITISAKILLINNPSIKNAAVEKQMAHVEKQFNALLDDNKITMPEAKNQINSISERINAENKSRFLWIIAESVALNLFQFASIFFLYFIALKYLFKSSTSFNEILALYGLAQYILVIKVISIIIISIILKRVVTGISIADISNVNKFTLDGFMMGKADIASIWFYCAFGNSIAYYQNEKRVINAIFKIIAIWLISSALAYMLLGGTALARFLYTI